jgi:hypothetical protein
MLSKLAYGLKLLSRWRRSKPQVLLRPYLQDGPATQAFNDAGVALAPSAPGVYLLYRSGRLIYVGSTTEGTGIREELERHRCGAYGPCTQEATAFDYELSAHPTQACRDYLWAHSVRYGGRLPPCNGHAADH